MVWYVYIILCSDKSLYTGISTDPERRLRQHADGRGAKYFRGRKPLEIVYLESGHTRSSAGRRELQIKRMPHGDKAVLIASPGIEIAGRRHLDWDVQWSCVDQAACQSSSYAARDIRCCWTGLRWITMLCERQASPLLKYLLDSHCYLNAIWPLFIRFRFLSSGRFRHLALETSMSTFLAFPF